MTSPSKAVIVLTDNDEERLATLTQDVQSITAKAGTDITSAALAALISETLVRSSTVAKDVKKLQEELLAPIKLEEDAALELTKPLLTKLKEFDKGARERLVAWNDYLEAEAVRERDRLRLEAEAAAEAEAVAMQQAAEAKTVDERNTALSVAARASREQLIASQRTVMAPRGIMTDSGTTGIRRRWTFEVVKPEDVPREYLMVDEVKLLKAINNGLRTLAGVNISQKKGINVKG